MKLSYNWIIADDITDPTPYEDTEEDEKVEEEQPYEIFGGRTCPICGEPMLSNEYIAYGSLPGDWKHQRDIIMHNRCLTDETQEVLESLGGYQFTEDYGEAME